MRGASDYNNASVKNIAKNVKYNVGIHQKLLKLDGIREGHHQNYYKCSVYSVLTDAK